MRKIIPILVLIPFLLHFSSKAQVRIRAQVGIGYIEHFSTGIAFNFSGKRELSILYGSNFFVKPDYFSSYMIQYERFLNKLKFLGITPNIGIKGGLSIFTNEYYKWKLTVIVPFIGFNYQLNKRFNIFLDLGITYSREEYLKRIKYGEIGSYKEYLPEFKIGSCINLNN